MKRIVIYISSLLIMQSVLGVEYNTHCTIHLTNKDSLQIFYIQEGKEIVYEDTTGLDAYILNYKVDEPKRAYGYINNDLDHLIIFYLHSGTYTLNVDINNKTYNFQNSPLNAEKIQLIKKEDSLRAIYYIPTPGIIRDLIISGINRDSFETIYKKYDKVRSIMFYRYYMNQKEKSFLALEYIKSSINCASNFVNNEQLKQLFDKLPVSFQKYPSYKECKALFMLAVKRVKGKESAKPLWNGK